MFLGIDTSNYTTSLALFDGENIIQRKKVLTVKKGERGLRQSDAVFQHTVNMPLLMNELDFSSGIDSVGVSTRPRSVEGSYMPCFLVGENVATAVSKTSNVPLYKTSHQVGHILAALYSVKRLDLINKKFIAFHLSGGTTEALIVTPDNDGIVKCTLVASSSDLKAGQAVDRTGVLLGLDFPCGKELDALSEKSDREFKIKPSMQGLNCSLSGAENKVKKMMADNESREDIAKFVLSFVSASVLEMCKRVIKEYGEFPILFSGGVSSNSLLRKTINDNLDAYFAESEFSLDNASGTAVYAYLKNEINL